MPSQADKTRVIADGRNSRDESGRFNRSTVLVRNHVRKQPKLLNTWHFLPISPLRSAKISSCTEAFGGQVHTALRELNGRARLVACLRQT